MDSHLVQKTIDFSIKSKRGIHISDLAKIMDTNSKNDIAAMCDFLVFENLFTESEYMSTYRLSPFARKILSKHNSWPQYLEYLEAKSNTLNEKERIELELLKWSTKVSKFQVKTKWLPYIFSALGLIVSIIALITSMNNKEQLQKIQDTPTEKQVVKQNTLSSKKVDEDSSLRTSKIDTVSLNIP